MTSVLKEFDEKINKAVDDTNDDGAGNAKDFSKKELDKEDKKRKDEAKKDDKKEDTKKSVATEGETIEKSADLDRSVIEDIVAKHVDARFSELDKKMDKCIDLCGKMDMGKSFDNLMTKDEAEGIVTTFAKAYDAVEKMHGEITKSANDMQDLIAKSVKPADKEVEKSTEPAKDEAKVEKSTKDTNQEVADKVSDPESESQVEKSASYSTKEANGAENTEAKVEKAVSEPAEKEVKKSYTMAEVNDLLGNFIDRMHSEALSKSINTTEYERLNDLATDVQYQRVDEDEFNEFIDYATGKDANKAI